MSDEHYDLACTCGSVLLRVTGEPRVRGTCHCTDCRALLKIPFHEVTAWNADQVEIVRGEDRLEWYQHPSLRMQRVFCRDCGDTMFNTNSMDWRVISQQLHPSFAWRRSAGGSALDQALLLSTASRRGR